MRKAGCSMRGQTPEERAKTREVMQLADEATSYFLWRAIKAARCFHCGRNRALLLQELPWILATRPWHSLISIILVIRVFRSLMRWKKQDRVETT
ncbi:hypothetical protein BGW36DRAFT_377717 [Talaromyces proteolyticus]|uniref:Uncharacterized protein n=1 Tax=Talaromyces proteolyticus TaxID=1131652 RepID=A0AAD4Q283_9EURO|nr:uncharacterized protein BGW36DRAFT_377717 [Talaromyces proteolyticus]KAH8699300.1 hypothetical protein BGW36DRAFT_377717 [Talaromyces proteolyticus]